MDKRHFTRGKERNYPKFEGKFALTLYEYLENQKLTNRQFARDCGISSSHITDVLHGKHQPESQGGKYTKNCYFSYKDIVRIYNSKHKPFIVMCLSEGII